MDIGDDGRSVRIYACLNALKGESQNVLSPLTYFFEEYFFLTDGKLLSQTQLATFSQRALGWPITADIAEDFVPHFEALGWIQRKGAEAGTPVYVVTHPRPASTNDRDPTVALLNILKPALFEFCSTQAPLLFAQADPDDLLDDFLKWLMNLKNSKDGTSISEDSATEGESLLVDEEETSEKQESAVPYFFARFVEEVMDTDEALSKSIPNLWAVGMLLEVADEITRPATRSQKSELRIVLDAPVALTYLGTSGTASQEGIARVLDSLKAIGCKICVFDISCREINRTLSTLLKRLPAERYGRTADALRDRQVDEERVEYVRDHPDTALSAIGVEILKYNIDNTSAISEYFSNDLYEDFLSLIRWGEGELAKEHDAIATALIMRIRQGANSSEIFNNRYIFVTNNTTFFKVSNKYLTESRLIYHHHFPPIIPMKKLATIAWLQTGLAVSQTEIPKGVLVNVCARITSTRKQVLDKVHYDIS